MKNTKRHGKNAVFDVVNSINDVVTSVVCLCRVYSLALGLKNSESAYISGLFHVLSACQVQF